MTMRPSAGTCLGLAGRLVFRLLDATRLAKGERTLGATAVRMSNLTIINLALYWCGPMHEATLTSVLLLVQAVCDALALLVRYQLASLFYEVVR